MKYLCTGQKSSDACTQMKDVKFWKTSGHLLIHFIQSRYLLNFFGGSLKKAAGPESGNSEKFSDRMTLPGCSETKLSDLLNLS